MRHCPRPLLIFMLILAAFMLGCQKNKKAPLSTAPDGEYQTRVGILNDDGTEESMITILEAAGYIVTDLGHHYEYTGTDFSEFDIVFLLMGVEYDHVLPDEVQQGLLDFVTDGGTLVTTEWMTYSSNNDLLDPVLPLDYDGGYCDDGDGDCIDTITVVDRHPLTENLPSVFETPWDYSYSYCVVREDSQSDNVMNVLTGDNGGAMLGVGEYGKGYTIHWNNGGAYAGDEIWDENMVQILINIVEFGK